MVLDKITCKKLCNWALDHLLYTHYHQSDGAMVYIDIEQEHDSLNNRTVLKSYTFLAGGNNFAKH
jgi:hypothetical protein